MSGEEIKVQVLEGSDNKLDLAKLEDVLRRKLIIPLYQRPYAWSVEDIEEIFQTIGSSEEPKENICFFGSIILSKNEKINGYGQEGYYIIDGQQRLTSFLLILRVILDRLNLLSKNTEENQKQPTREQIKLELKLDAEIKKLSKIIKEVSLKREEDIKQPAKEEQSILDYISNGPSARPTKDLNAKINKINETIDEIENLLDFLDFILNKIKFCLICIQGKNSEEFAINLFNRLNTTGEPLTAFEVLISELKTIDEKLAKKINDIQAEIIRKYIDQRKKIVSHTGKLLLYLPLYRGDFEKNQKLSDNKFKEQRLYLKNFFKEADQGQESKLEKASNLVTDIKRINDFYSNYWENMNSIESLKIDNCEKLCLYFLSKKGLNHDRVLPILIRFHGTDSFSNCIKFCTAFSTIWRAYSDGGTSGIDKSYQEVSYELKQKGNKIKEFNKILKEKFLKKLSSKNIEEAKSSWINQMKNSAVYKNKKLSKFLLFLSYNQKFFDYKEKKLKQGSKLNDMLDIYHWKKEDYQTIEHIIPKSDKEFIGQVHALGNLTLLPKKLNSSMGHKPFSKKQTRYKEFCQKENDSDFPYLPILKHLTHYPKFEKEEIEKRSEVLSSFIWETLVEKWLKWKD